MRSGRRRPLGGQAGLRYDDGEPISVAKILQYRGDKVARETLYFADPFPAPDWRRPWADDGAPRARPGDLPASIRGGS